VTRFALAVFAVLTASAAVSAQQNQLPADGSEYFRFFFHRHSVSPLTRFEDAVANPADSIIVCTGDVGWINRLNRGRDLAQYVRNGGAVLIATEGPCETPFANSWEQQFGVSISGRPLTAKADDLYEAADGQVFVVPVRRPAFDFAADSPFEMFKGVRAAGPDAVTTNTPTELAFRQINPLQLTPTQLATYPASAKGMFDNLAVAQRNNTFAASFQAPNGRGRLLVVADHGVFVNGQIRLTVDQATGDITYPTANKRFADQVIDWLQGPDRSRTACLFMENGEPKSPFAVKADATPDMMPPIPPIAPDVLINLLLRSANPVIGELQNRARPNNALSRWPGPAAIRRAFLVFLSLVLLWLIWTRVGKATRGDDRSRWTSLAMLGGLLPKGSANKRKRADLIETGNVYEAARWRVRDRFNRLGGQPTEAGDMPPFLMADSSRQAAGLEQQVRRLWHIGYGSRPVPVPIHMWDELNVNLERAVRLAAKGVWCFAAGVETDKKS